jgi:hypothetical protein
MSVVFPVCSSIREMSAPISTATPDVTGSVSRGATPKAVPVPDKSNCTAPAVRLIARGAGPS